MENCLRVISSTNRNTKHSIREKFSFSSSHIDTMYHDLSGLDENEFLGQVKRFKSTLEEIRRQSLAAMLKKMDEHEMKVAEEVTMRMIDKIIQLPVLQLKKACKRSDVGELSESLNELFNIEIVNKVKS